MWHYCYGLKVDQVQEPKNEPSTETISQIYICLAKHALGGKKDQLPIIAILSLFNYNYSPNMFDEKYFLKNTNLEKSVEQTQFCQHTVCRMQNMMELSV